MIVSSVSTAEQISGSWQVLRGISEQFGKFATEAKQAADNLRPIDKPELWKGTAADGFRNDLHAMVQVLDLHAGVYPRIAKDLFEYSEVIRLAEGECVFEIDPKAAAVFQTMAAQEGEQILYDQAKARRDADVAAGVPKDCLVPLPAKPDKDAVADALLQLRKQLGRLVHGNEEANTKCYLKLRGYIDELKQTPNISFNAFVDGVRDGVVDLAKLAWTLDPARVWVEPQAYFTDLAAVAKGMTQPLYDPVGFAQDMKQAAAQTWDQFLANPAYATGRLVPDLALAAGTGGTGPAATEAMAAATARVAARREELRLAREQAERDARDGATAESVPPGARTQTGEPVNAATGEMILVQRDVELPGALPLVLTRRHLTRSVPGRLFGRRWASTLDQHLRLGRDGVVFVTEDGVELAYPVPEPGVPIMPVGGDRWPLEWDGVPGGIFTVTDPRRGWSWSFAPAPRRADPVLPIRSISDRNGNRIQFSYDETGMPYEVAHSGGYRIAVDTADERVTALRLLDADPATHARTTDPTASIDLVRFAYDEPGNVTEVINSSGRPMLFTYDNADRITSWTDRNVNWYRYTYDKEGRCVHGVGPDGVMDNAFAYDTDAQVTRMTDALGAVRTFAWDRLGRVVAETDPLGNTVHTEWDAFHRRVSVTDQLGQTTRFTYDDPGNLIGIVHPDGTYTVADFDPMLCRPTQIINSDGTRRRYTWDERGNLLSLIDEAGARTQYRWDVSGALAEVTDALGGITRFVSDGAGLPVSSTDPLGRATYAVRDVFGRTASVTDPMGHVTRTAWTVEGNPAWRELADGSREFWTWDGEGNLLHHQNAAGFVTRHEFGPFDLPTTQTDPDGNRHTFAYDAELRLTAVTNARNLTWTYAYDAAGHLVSETDFNGRTLVYRHDPAGRLVSRVNGAGEEVAYIRDPFGKVTESAHTATGRTTTYAYDPAGRLVRAVNPDVDLTFTRDARGRILTESSNGRTLANTYDLLGRRIRRETPSGHVSTWTYDAAGQPTRLATPDHRLDFAYDAAGRDISRHFGDQVTFTQEWDPVGRLTVQATAVGARPDNITAALSPGLGPTETHRRTYDWRPDGYITAIHDTTTGTKTYDLDTVGRITAVRAKNWTERYAYDNLGNIAHAEWPLTPDASAEDAQGERHFAGTLIRRAGRTTYEHDAQGRLTRKTRRTLSGKTLTWTYSWDPEDRLTGVTNPRGEQWIYKYDALARRVEKMRYARGEHIAAERHEFAWDGARLVWAENPDGLAFTWDYSGGGWNPVLQTTRTRTDPSDSRCHAFLADGAGSEPTAVNTDGSIAWRARWNLWSDGSDHSPLFPLRFPGHFHDPESGLALSYHRYYDSLTAQFLTADPLGLAPAPLPHGYVVNPTRWFDPTGLAPCPNTPLPVLGTHPGGWAPVGIPQETIDIIREIENDGAIITSRVDGVQGPVVPERFANDGRNGGHQLPTHDASGKPITYTEWGTKQSAANPKPGNERIVVGSDGSIYYTPTHYQTFMRYK